METNLAVEHIHAEDERARYETEKAEDEKRWQRYKETGIHIPHEAMKAIMKELRMNGKSRQKSTDLGNRSGG